MSNVVMISVYSSYPVVGNKITEDEHTVVLEYPVAIFKDNPHVYTTQYMPFAEGGLVSFFKQNIISVANVQENIEKYYHKAVEYYKTAKPINYEVHNGDEEEAADSIESFVEGLTKTVH